MNTNAELSEPITYAAKVRMYYVKLDTTISICSHFLPKEF